MTRARRISSGERTHAERQLVHDPANPQTFPNEPQTGEPVEQPERLCKRCEGAADPNTAYGMVISGTGLGHYTADDGTTLCGLDTAEMSTA